MFTRSPTFNSLNQLFDPIRQRLDHYRSPAEAGRWNEKIAMDLGADPTFMLDAERLHDAALQSHFPNYPPCSDGSSIYRVDIDFERRMRICFQVYLLWRGYSVIPAMYVLQKNRDGTHKAEYGCGVPDRNGEFEFSGDHFSSHLAPFPEELDSWIIHKSRTYGANSLRRWMPPRNP